MKKKFQFDPGHKGAINYFNTVTLLKYMGSSPFPFFTLLINHMVNNAELNEPARNRSRFLSTSLSVVSAIF